MFKWIIRWACKGTRYRVRPVTFDGYRYWEVFRVNYLLGVRYDPVHYFLTADEAYLFVLDCRRFQRSIQC